VTVSALFAWAFCTLAEGDGMSGGADRAGRGGGDSRFRFRTTPGV